MPIVPTQFQFTAKVQSNLIRAEILQGQQYLVIPVSAIKGDNVWHPMGVTGPQLVPMSTLESSAFTFNDLPITWDHPPTLDDSARTVEILESQGLGRTYNARVEDGFLKFEHWYNVDLVAKIDGAQDHLDSIIAGGEGEISIGATGMSHEEEGNVNGRDYTNVLDSMIGDHSAMLKPGQVGACSNKDGCKISLAAKNKGATMPMTSTERRLLIASREQEFKILSKYNNEYSDGELRGALFDALKSTVPAFDWIPYDGIYSDQGVVFYETYTESAGQRIFRTSFTFENGEASVAPFDGDSGKPRAKHVAVERVTEFKPVAAETVTLGTDNNNVGTPPTPTKGDGNMPNLSAEESAARKPVVDRLINCEQCPYEESDRDSLMAFDETKLSKMLTTFQQSSGSSQQTEPAEVDDSQYVKKDSDEYRELLAGAKENRERKLAERKTNINVIEATGKDGVLYGEDFYEGLSDEKIATLAAKVEKPGSTPKVVNPLLPLPIKAKDDDSSDNEPKPFVSLLDQAIARGKGGTPATN